MTLYEKALCAMAEYEVELLQKSGQEFVFDKATFDANCSGECIYGQTFGSAKGDAAIAFKESNNIATGFSNNRYAKTSNFTALETLTERLWHKGEKEKVYKIVEKFGTWKDEETVTGDLFTL